MNRDNRDIKMSRAFSSMRPDATQQHSKHKVESFSPDASFPEKRFTEDIYVDKPAMNTYSHRLVRTRLPVCSAKDKLQIG